MDYDKTTMPAAYDAGRSYSPGVLDCWLRIISAAIAERHIADILDLGCGTGRYSSALAEHFQAQVVGVDPSKKMLGEARKKAAKNVIVMQGAGEAIPLADASIDMVFLSMVFHHFGDRQKVAQECRRVLRSSGVVCLRAGVTNRIEDYPYVPFFPETRPILNHDLQSVAQIEATFAGAAFQRVHHEIVRSEVACSWADYANKVANRADSVLIQLRDATFQIGLAALWEHAKAAPPGEPVIEPVDFFVFSRT